MSLTDKKKASVAIQAIVEIRKKEGDKRRVQGVIPCPDCKKDFHYSIASNGHIRGQCTGCGVAFIM